MDKDAAGGVSGKVDRRVVKTRAAIQRAFRKLLKERGLGKVTVSALARQADIDRKTFSLHYDSIDDLVDKEAEFLVDEIVATVERVPASAGVEAQVRAALDRVNEMLAEDLELYEYIARNLSVDFVLGHIERAVARGVEQSPLSARLPCDEDVVWRARFYLAGAISVYSAWLCSGRERPVSDVAGIVSDALVAAYGALAARPA